MLFAALFNPVGLCIACLFLFFYFAIEFCIVIIYTNAFCLSAMSLGY